jgi:hypothetical protein
MVISSMSQWKRQFNHAPSGIHPKSAFTIPPRIILHCGMASSTISSNDGACRCFHDGSDHDHRQIH